MANHGTDQKGPKFYTKLGILIGFIVEVATSIFFRMSEDELQHWILKKESIRKQLRTMFKITDSFVEEKEYWRKFYQKHFSSELNFTNLVILEKPNEGSWRLIIIAEGLTLNQVFSAWKKLFKCWRYNDDLDVSITKNARDSKIAYAIWVRDGIEPDAEYLGESTRQADPDMKIGVTLLERMVHELVYFDETGKHLDVKGVTSCTGSRYADGGVPCVRWYSVDQEVRVGWYGLDDSDSARGLRSAVS
jgi:hypothetical protein